MNTAEIRKNMVNGQLRPNAITCSEILERFLLVPRESFLPPPLRDTAYKDTHIALGEGRVLFSPLLTAGLLQAINPQKHQKALVLAAGSGYTAALLCGLVNTVYMQEERKQWCQNARNVLADHGCAHITVIQGDSCKGHPAKAPYDIIWIEGAIQHIPEALCEQLKPEGKIVAVHHTKNNLAEAAIFTYKQGTIQTQTLFETTALPIIKGFESKEEFLF